MVRGFCRRADFPPSDIEEAGDVLEVEILHPDGENSLVCYFLTLVGQRLKIMVAAAVPQAERCRDLVKLSVARERFFPQHKTQHMPQLSAGDLEQIHAVIVGERLGQVSVGHNRSQPFGPDAAGTQQHDIHAKALGKDIGQQGRPAPFPDCAPGGSVPGGTAPRCDYTFHLPDRRIVQ